MFPSVTELMFLEVKCLEKDFPSFQGKQAAKNPSVSIMCHKTDNLHGSSELKWLDLALPFTFWASVIIDSSKGLSFSVGWHLRNKEHFDKAPRNLEVCMFLLSCWLYNVCLWALSVLFQLRWPLPRNHSLSSVLLLDSVILCSVL